MTTSTNTLSMSTYLEMVNSEEYKEATSGRLVRYTISKNMEKYPELEEQFNSWRDDQPDFQTPSFDGIFHDDYGQVLFDIRNAEIREDSRNGKEL